MRKSFPIPLFLAASVASLAPMAALGAVLDLTTLGSSGVINTATFAQGSIQPAGSGVIDPFVRISTNDAQEEAYNTTVNNVLDNDSTDTWNHEITIGQVGFIDVNGTLKMRFLLDINEPNAANKKLLNLDEVQIFVSTIANQSVTSFNSGVLGLASSTLVYRMDLGDDNTVILDYNNASGQGETDMTLDIPKTLFDSALMSLLGASADATAKNGAFIYLYSAFGSPPNINDSAYEEWAKQGTGSVYVDCTENCGGGGGGTIPEPATLVLMGLGLLGLAASRRKLV